MATTISQRIFIWVILVAMVIGAVGVYFVAILANNNDQADQQKQMEAYQQMMEEQSKLRAASSKPLEGYSAEPFDAASVVTLEQTDLVEGEGKEVTAESTIEANYFGWTADGKIFDSTNQEGEVSPATFSLQQVIRGWTEGLTGAREGTVRKIVIPTELAYGADAASQGRPAGPLAFIVEIKAVK